MTPIETRWYRQGYQEGVREAEDRTAQVAHDCAKQWEGLDTKYMSLTGAANHIAARIEALKNKS